MQVLVIGLAWWIAASAAFGVVWVLSAFALKEARRRWPQTAVDPAWAPRPLDRK